MILKILNTLKQHIQSNLKVPHPTLVALGITIAITIVLVYILSMADNEMMGIDNAEAATKFKPKIR